MGLLTTALKSVKALIALAREKPGELTFASSGMGGAPHLMGEFFALTTSTKLTCPKFERWAKVVKDANIKPE